MGFMPSYVLMGLDTHLTRIQSFTCDIALPDGTLRCIPASLGKKPGVVIVARKPAITPLNDGHPRKFFLIPSP